ncbi:MAG: ATP-binding protein [Bryobacteraceae bacterium]|nr:ATP-binding protein [Bryobacteraceae bacterium]
MALAVVFRFLGAGLYVFLAGVIWGQRRTPPAGGVVLALLIAMGVWDMAWPASLHPLGWAAAALAGGCVILLMRVASRPFAITLGMLTAAWGLGLVAGIQSAPAAIASVAMGVYLAGAFYWKRTFGLVLTHRSLFAVALGIFSALYLAGVRLVSGLVEWSWALELALLFGAGLLWIPVYAWITRYLSRRNEMLAAFGKSMVDDASRILDLDGRMEFIAREVVHRFGAQRASLIYRDRRTAGGETGYPYRFPLRLENRELGLLLVDAGAHRFLNDEESLLRALAPQIAQSLEAGRLIEEKIGLERELARQENLAEMGRAAAAIAHEIKNPLSSIKTLVQLMGEDATVAGAHGDSLEFIGGEIDRLDRSLRQLLGFARAPLELTEQVDLSKLLQSLAAAMKPAIAAEVEPGLVLPHSNEELLRQVFLNLLLNAEQAARSKVTMRAGRVAGGIEVHIGDDGPGIPPELREKVFTPFFTTRQRGTGLGLAIVRNNIRRLGGEISLECPEAGGTVVKVRLSG